MANENIGSYRGVPINPGTQEQVNQQVADINSALAAKTPPTVPTGAGTPATPPTQPTPTAPTGNTAPNPMGVDDQTFLGYMNKMNTSFQQSNTLIDQKNALLHASMGNQMDAATIAKLPPDVQALIQSGNRDAMRLSAQSLNDQISNNSNSVASSISYLTSGYENSVKTANDQKQAELNNLMQLASTFVNPATGTVDIKKAGDAFQSLYPGVDMSGVLSQLQGMMPVSEYNKQFYQGQLTNTGGGGGVGNYDLSSYATDPNYVTAISGIAGNIGTISSPQDAQAYITKNFPSAPITGDMVVNAATKFNVDPTVLMAQLQQESQMGTSKDATVDNNPSGITWTQAYQDAHPGTTKGAPRPEGGNYVHFSSLQDGVAANAQWLSQHQNLSDVKEISKGIESGMQPPDLSRLYGKSAQVRAQLQRDGYDFTKATLDWTATQAFVKNSNSAAQVRMRQAESSVEQTLPNLQTYVDKLNADGAISGFQFVNKASITAAANGVYGKKAADDAQALLGQLSLVTDELGQTFMGGNSPTDAAFGLAKGVLNGDFTASQFKTQIGLVQQNLAIRKNSWSSAGVVSPTGGTNAYAGSGTSDTSTGGGNDPLGLGL